MGSYLNPGSNAFRMAVNSPIFVDKSGLAVEMNRRIQTLQRFVCVSRPRRFGKSMAADMLAAYYDSGEDTTELFAGLAVSQSATYREHLNQYDVIKINMQEFLSATRGVEEMLSMLQRRVLAELKRKYPQYIEEEQLVFVMQDVYAQTRQPFVILIDEWDCLFREYKNDTQAQKEYLDFLRAWLKDKDYVALAYMTGILPIKNVPILRVPEADEATPEGVERSIKFQMPLFMPEGRQEQIAVSLSGGLYKSFAAVQRLAEAVISGARGVVEGPFPLIVVVEADIGKALGHALNVKLEHKKPVICIDGIHSDSGDYIDLGEPVFGGHVLPVVIKTLIFNS